MSIINSEKSIVQFNVVNITANPISVDLFDLATLNTTPIQPNYINPPNSIVSQIVTGFFYFFILNNGNLFKVTSVFGLTQITIFNTNNIIIFSTTLFFSTSNTRGAYNSLNNTVYFISNATQTVRVYDCNTNTITSIIPFLNITDVYGQFSFYNSVNNNIYLINSNTNSIDVFNCFSNTFTSSILSPSFISNSTQLLFNSNQNVLYINEPTLITSEIFDCNTNTFTSTLPISVKFGAFNPNNNNIYVPDGLTFLSIIIFNVISNSVIGTITLNQPSNSFGAIDLNSNYIYFVSGTAFVNVIDSISNTLLTTVNTGNLTNVLPVYNPITQLMLIGGLTISFQQIILFITPLGVIGSPYYVTGAVNYNYFVESLQNEPIIVSKIRVISPQTQLDNVANILTIDSNGIQSQYPVIPLLTVSAWQEQGNISELKFKDLVFDGRKYISNYTINANTTVILEIHYEQLDNTKIRYLGKMLPKKVPLKGFFDDYVDLSM